MRKLVLLLAGAAGLSGCSLIDPQDWREGAEGADDCASRLESALVDFRVGDDSKALLIPTYTYDITKLDLEASKALIRPGSDETLGSRLVAETNNRSTAYQRFYASRVDSEGAFFLGGDPALFRVQGRPLPHSEILAAGCARQAENMRLIKVQFAPFIPPEIEPAPEPKPKPGPKLDQEPDGAAAP